MAASDHLQRQAATQTSLLLLPEGVEKYKPRSDCHTGWNAAVPGTHMREGVMQSFPRSGHKDVQ